MRKYKTIDAIGKKINKGDIDRVIGIPNLSNMAVECIKESEPVFRYLIGKYKTVIGFNEIGEVELRFEIRKGLLKGYHTVWIEPYLLKVKEIKI